MNASALDDRYSSRIAVAFTSQLDCRPEHQPEDPEIWLNRERTR